jgi:hypothetical protein
MSRTRIVLGLAGLVLLVAATARLAAAWFPLVVGPTTSITPQDRSSGPIQAGSARMLILDDAGHLSDPTSGTTERALMQHLSGLKEKLTFVIAPSPEVPIPRLELALRTLHEHRIRNLALLGGFVVHDGRAYYSLDGPNHALIAPPKLAVDRDRLTRLARVSRRLHGTAGPGGIGATVLRYRLYIDQRGNVASVQLIRGIEIVGLATALAQTRVIRPGRRGRDPVPTAVLVDIPTEK